MGALQVVGISDCKASKDSTDSIVTYALGSCVGLALYDPQAKVGGLLHIMLPDSRYRSSSRDFNPHMYADTGFYALTEALLALGASKSRLTGKAAGGANMLRHSSLLDIGQRNSERVLELLRREGIPLLASSLGGTVGRSMRLHIDDGTTVVRLLGEREVTL